MPARRLALRNLRTADIINSFIHPLTTGIFILYWTNTNTNTYTNTSIDINGLLLRYGLERPVGIRI